jgi:hypothetical protein
MAGVIASAGFESGDRFVIGSWTSSPVGPMTDVMWARPDGERVLLAPSEDAADFITGVYRFDRVEMVPVAATTTATTVEVVAEPVELLLSAGRGWRLPFGRFRPPALTRWVEAPLARALLGVRTYGTSPTGVREWYRADEYRPVVDARASISGRELGGLRPLHPPCRFGFSEPPRRPSLVKVRPLLAYPSS